MHLASVVKLKGAGLISWEYLGAFGINMLNLQFGHHHSKTCLGGKPTTLTKTPEIEDSVCDFHLSGGPPVCLFLDACGINMLILQVGQCYSKKIMEMCKPTTFIMMSKNIGAELTHCICMSNQQNLETI